MCNAFRFYKLSCLAFKKSTPYPVRSLHTMCNIVEPGFSHAHQSKVEKPNRPVSGHRSECDDEAAGAPSRFHFRYQDVIPQALIETPGRPERTTLPRHTRGRALRARKSQPGNRRVLVLIFPKL